MAKKKRSLREVNDEIRQGIADRLVTAMEDGKIPWRRPWDSDPNSGLPTNISSSKPYQGINSILLNLAALDREYRPKWWGTYKQWAVLGGQVRKRPKDADQWGIPIIVWKRVTRTKVDDDGEEKESSYSFIKTFTVFNLDQVDDTQGKLEKFQVQEHDPLAHPDYQAGDRLVVATGADIRYGGNRAAYRSPEPLGDWPKHTRGDYILTPTSQQYHSARDYYETIFHELMHWAEVRIGWEPATKTKRHNRGSEAYALGELIAEMGACFVLSSLGLPLGDDLDNHAAYLQGWIKAMKHDAKYVFAASAQASKGADFILQHNHE